MKTCCSNIPRIELLGDSGLPETGIASSSFRALSILSVSYHCRLTAYTTAFYCEHALERLGIEETICGAIVTTLGINALLCLSILKYSTSA